jgi:tetratricopeptide (TPR) repeat protein
MESSVRYAGGRIRVTAQLIDAATDAHLWAETYERPFEDIFEIQTDIATKIAAALKAELSSDELERIESPPTDSTEAYALYLRGRAAFAGTPATAVLAQDYFDQAIALDPNFADAYAWKALYYVLPIAAADSAAPEDSSVRARFAALGRENAERALALDSNIGIAHTVLGWANLYEWNWQESSAAFSRAIELSPNEPASLTPHGYSLFSSDRREEGLSFLQRSISLDPNRAIWRVVLGHQLALSGDPGKGAESFGRAVDLDPGFGDAMEGLAVASAQAGDLETARRAARLLENLWRNDTRPAVVPGLIRAYQAAGMPDDASRILAELELLAQRQTVSAMTWFLAYHAIDDRSSALNWLETAVRTHDTYGRFMLALRTQNEFTASYWDDPRFQRIRKDLGFTD